MPSVRSQAAGGSKSAYTPEPYDWYIEDSWSVDLLLRAEPFKGAILDPACGQGTIPARAMAHGLVAYGSDIVERPQIIADCQFARHDFFGEMWDGENCADNIICNPPYSYEKGIAARFIGRALRVARRKVAMLVPTKFLASQDRYLLFTCTPLARVYILSSRPSMPPGSLLTAGKVKRGGGKVDYCWMVWDRDHQGETVQRFLIRPDHLERARRRAAGQAKKEAER